MDALGMVCAVLVAAALTWLPGWLVLRAWGIRHTRATLGAAPMTAAILTLLGVATDHLPLLLTPVTYLATVTGLVVIGLVVTLTLTLPTIRHLLRLSSATARAPWELRRGGWELTCVQLIALVAASVVFVLATGGLLELPSQSWDASSHVSALWSAATTGVAGPQRIQTFIDPTSGFYPSAFMCLGAPFVWFMHCDAVAASNLAAAVLAGLVWPSTVTILARAILGEGPVVSLGTPLLALGAWGFPWAPLSWGVLWPTAMGVVMAPLALAGSVRALTLGHDLSVSRAAVVRRRSRAPVLRLRSRLGALLFTASALALVALGHPRIVPLTLVPMLVIVAAWLVTTVLSGDRAEVPWAIAGGLAAAVAAAAALRFRIDFGTTDKVSTVTWADPEPLPTRVLQQVTGGVGGGTPFVVLAVLTVIGVVRCFVLRGRILWLPVAWLAVLVIDGMTASGATSGTVADIVRWWYADAHRSTGLVAVISIPIAMLGADWLVGGVRARLRPGAATRALAAVAALAVLTGSVWPALTTMAYRYRVKAGMSNGYVSPEEVSFLSSVAQLTKGGGRVLNNPTDGSAFAFGYAGVSVTYLTSWLTTSVVGADELRGTIGTSPDHARVCSLLHQSDIRWVLDLGPTLTDDSIAPAPAPALDALANGSWVARPVLWDGQHTLYLVDGCNPDGTPVVK